MLGNRLTREDGANYAVSQERSYDAWGAIRSGIKDTTKLTYCANLGHKEDDESGLIYMRARYYEPGSGRFISEDPARDGPNWSVYCGSDPINFSDKSGEARKKDLKEYVEAVRKAFRDGRISKEYFDRFMNRSSDVWRAVHDAITQQGLTPQEIGDWVEDDYRMRKGIRGIGIGLTTLDSAFSQDPLFVLGLIADIGGGWQCYENLGF